MPENSRPSVNSWLEDELFQQYQHDRKTVDSGWTQVFETNGHSTPATTASPTSIIAPARVVEPPPLGPGDQLVPLRGPALRIAENMTASLSIPVATSQRTMPVKVLEENRRAINQFRSAAGQSKVSYTHLVAWAIVRALDQNPALNQAFAANGAGAFRITRNHVNFGIAVDVEGKEGARSLKVPSIKNAQAMSFAQFLAAYDELVTRAAAKKLPVGD